jgi:hypothetical protein
MKKRDFRVRRKQLHLPRYNERQSVLIQQCIYRKALDSNSVLTAARVWIFLSGSVIIFNKWVLDTLGFRMSPISFVLITGFPIILTTWHLIFATVCTQILARKTTLIDGRKTVKMDAKTYIRSIVPVGAFFSLSLIFCNQAYLYLSVAFIQMLKATTPVAVLLTMWGMQVDRPSFEVLVKVTVIVVGVIIASYGEFAFVFAGFFFQACGILAESLRLVLVQKLLSSPEHKMDPLVSLYYFAPVNTVQFALTIGLRRLQRHMRNNFRRTKDYTSSSVERRCRVLPQCRCRLPRMIP